MKKSELINNISLKYNDISTKEISSVVDVMLEEVSSSLKKGFRVELRGFGVFNAKERNFAKARNPKTGESVSVAPRKNVKFKMSTRLQKDLN
ncbi:MAG: integration host factor subunit beta [Proteobacteria bacterium]|nr:integration host factor subunit beta [Pseudomonadota bacterium]